MRISDWSSDVCSSDLIVEDMRKAMAGLPGIEPSFTQPIEMRVSEMLTGARGDLAVKLFGPDLATLGDLSGQVQEILSKVAGAAEVVTVVHAQLDYSQLDTSRDAAGRHRVVWG